MVKDFIKNVQERAIGQDVMNGLNPGQMVVKIVNEELVKLMGSETTEIQLQPGNSPTVILMAGLQGAGKTTTAAKLAGKFRLKGKKPLLVACDVYRPAAIKQLQVNGEKQGVEVFSMGENHKPANIAKAALEHAQKNGNNIIILDTAGRLHIDEDMMEELTRDQRGGDRPSDHPGDRRHDRSGRGKCSQGVQREGQGLTASSSPSWTATPGAGRPCRSKP